MSAAPLSVMQSADDVRQGLTWTQRVTQHMECLLNRGECASSHLSRKKTRREFVRLSGAVAGIEFCYSAETAYVSPILMSLGIPVSLATTVWCLSPMLGFFLSPLFGSLSDCCTSPLGRRRPFILLLSAGICLGLLLLPNAHLLGAFFASDEHHVHVWTIVLTILGTLLLDFCCDACQSPSRTYLLDVTQPEEHSLGLSTFTVMAGLGGSLGYFIGFVPWENIGALSWLLQDQVRTVFTLVGIIFVVCVAATVTSFPEVPLKVRPNDAANVAARHYCELADEEAVEMQDVKCMGNASASGGGEQSGRDEARDEPLGFREYVKSIILMPEAFRILCVTNLFSWMSLVCYSLYFTDFVGESVFGGEPTAPEDSEAFFRYQSGVRFGSFAMALYSLSCALYSYNLDALLRCFGCKAVYVYGQLTYAAGMIVIGLTKSKIAVLCCSMSAGIQYATLFTMPYLLIARYHQAVLPGAAREERRGMGTDIAVVGSQVFLAQLSLSLFMGKLIQLIGSNVVTVYAAALLATCGAAMATQVVYCEPTAPPL